jgi:hypothetical protein
MQDISHSNTALISEIARHFVLSDDTTRRLLKNNDFRPCASHPVRYWWRDVWALECVGYVPPHLEDELRRPLMKVSDVRRRFLPHLTDRAIRDRAARGALPGIQLGSDWRFRECDMREAAIHG